MKKLTFILALAISMMAIAGEPYCHKQLTAGNKTVYMTAQHLSDNSYRLLIEADENMNGLGGSFVFVNGNEPYQLNTTEHFVLASDKRSITCDITSTAAPAHYTPLYVLFENGGESNFGQPDADYSQTCEGGEEGQGGEGGEGGDNPGGQGGEGGEGGLTPDKPEPSDTLSPYDVNFWTNIDWLGNGSGIEANTQMYKIHCADGQQVANIQVAPWDDNNVGIYTWVESAVTSVSVAAGIQGAGLLLHLSAFVNKITEVQIGTAETTYLCFVFFKNGVDNTISSDPSDPSDTEDAIRDASVANQVVKCIRDGRLIILRDGMPYDAMGVRM